MFCREQVAQLRDAYPDLQAAGAEVAVVGNGRPHQAHRFAIDAEVSFPLLTDPELVAYRAAGLRRTFASSLNLSTFGNALSTMGRGFRQGRTQGDPWQQGGTFLLAPGDQVLFRHVSKAGGDHPDLSEILSIAQAQP